MAVILVSTLASAVVLSHPLAPSLLALNQLEAGQFSVRWKTPLKQAPGSELSPVLPAHCLAVSDQQQRISGSALETSWSIDCGDAGVVGAQVGARHIGDSGADVILRVSLSDGRVYQQVLSPAQSVFTIPERVSVPAVFGGYLWLGMEHLWGGLDHLLFVIALVVLIGVNKKLVWTITSFTVGHSVTLSLAALGLLRFPQSVAELFIAVSLIAVAVELIRNDGQGWFHRYPWLCAGGFGLLHGLGFAGVLADIGLPQEALVTALLAFNLGIELAQLLVIALLALVLWFLVKSNWRLPAISRGLVVYGLGGLSSFWFWERLTLLS
ncbi:HupE/UreJ family protein [Sinobacterium norvegicum]|uniref:HupE/UreJ family protein n=1 Tax=Sinobacterium norvegicum TaxID=1641715 RepID=UPI001F2F41F2|nr:HupE/UreJ family protein [Sinobacterium norvegicum]